MTTYKMALIPGDGIGPEVTAEGVRVLDAVAALDGGFRFEWTRFPWGGRLLPEARENDG